MLLPATQIGGDVGNRWAVGTKLHPAVMRHVASSSKPVLHPIAKTLWPQAYLSGEMDFSGLPRNSLVKSLVVRRNRWEKSLGVGSESLSASGEIAGRFSVDFACKLSGAAALSWAADDD